VAAHLVKLACELPDDDQRRSLSLWTCAELARALNEAKVVDTISPQSVQRLLESHHLKPWRVHFWLSPKAPRDEVFRQQVLELMKFITEWNATAHPFAWTLRSFAKILAQIDAALAKAA